MIEATRSELAGLTTHIIGPPSASVTVVLLHGFGASGDDLVPLGGELARGEPAAIRYVFPEAPIEIGGVYGAARCWWMLDLARLEAALRTGTPRDYRDEAPPGLLSARAHLLRFLDHLAARFPDTRLVLGGFSQGAMLALDVALALPRPPAGVLLWSGTLLNQPEWQPRFSSLRGVPVLQSHGRGDPLLPFFVAEALRDQLVAAGAAVDWQPFIGGHEIPRAAVVAASKLVRAVAQP